MKYDGISLCFRSTSLALVVGATAVANAEEIGKADNQDALALGTSWVEGVAPRPTDVAVWDGEVAASGNWTYGLGADVAWYGLRVTNSVSALTVANDGSTLTLGAGGIDFAAATNFFNVTCNAPLVLSASQTWRTTSPTVFYQWGPVTANGKLTLKNGGGTGRFCFYEACAFPDGLVVEAGEVHIRTNACMTGSVSVSPGGHLYVNRPYDTDWSGTFVSGVVTNDGQFDFGGFTGMFPATVSLGPGDRLAPSVSASSTYQGRVNVANHSVAVDGGYLGANWFYLRGGSVALTDGKVFVDYAMYAGCGAPVGETNRNVDVSGGTLEARRLHVGSATSETYPGAVTVKGGYLTVTRANAVGYTGISLAEAKMDYDADAAGSPAGCLTVEGGVVRTLEVAWGSLLRPRDSTWNVTNGYARFDLKGGEVTIGAAGMGPHEVWGKTATNMPSDTAQAWYDVNLSGGTLGAYGSYTNRARTRLCDDDGGVTLRASDTNGTPYNVTMTQPLVGPGKLRKTGAGSLTLTAANTYTGATVVAEGTLEMVATSLWTEASVSTSLSPARAIWVAQSLAGAAGSTVTAWAATNVAIEFNSTVAAAVKSWYTSPHIGENPMNGWKVVSFDGMSNALAITGGSNPVYGASNLTIVVVMRPLRDGVGAASDDWRTKTGVIGQDFDANWWGIALCSGGRVGAGMGDGTGTVTAWAPPRGLCDGNPHVFIHSWANGSNVTMNADGFYSARYDKPQQGSRVKTRTILGASEHGSCCKADIAEIRIYTNTLSVSEQQRLGLALARKYGCETAGYLQDLQAEQGSLASAEVRVEPGATFQAASVGTRIRPGQIFCGAGTVGGTLVVGTNGVIRTTADEALTLGALTFEPGGVYQWQYTTTGASGAITVRDLTLPPGVVTIDIDAAGASAAPHGVLLRYTGLLTDNGVTWQLRGGHRATRVVDDAANKCLYLSTPTGTVITVQ